MESCCNTTFQREIAQPTKLYIGTFSAHKRKIPKLDDTNLSSAHQEVDENSVLEIWAIQC